MHEAGWQYTVEYMHAAACMDQAEDLQPFIEIVHSQIEKLESMSTSCERVHVASSPSIEAIAAADLPSVSSDGSEQ